MRELPRISLRFIRATAYGLLAMTRAGTVVNHKMAHFGVGEIVG